jgi:hypothetical protein
MSYSSISRGFTVSTDGLAV